jgi:mono/diheme cytochrome c family protein
MSEHNDHASGAAPSGPRESYLGQREGWLTAFSVVALAVLVLSYVGFMRAGHVETFGGVLPSELASTSGGVYSKNCSSCHGAKGGGGVGPAFTGGAVAVTFPDPVDHVRWVILGSAGGADLYTAAGKAVKGGMPNWGPSLTLTDIVHAVLYERQEIGRHPLADDLEGWKNLGALIEEFPDLAYTQDEVDTLIAEIEAAAATA